MGAKNTKKQLNFNTTNILMHLCVFFFRDVFMEKHWKSVISRSICDYFFDAQNKATSPSEVRIQIELFILDITIYK